MSYYFDNYLDAVLAYEFYSTYYQSIASPRRLIRWIVDTISNDGIDQFVHHCILILNNVENHHRFRALIDIEKSFEIIESGLNFEFKALSARFELDETDLLYCILLSWHEPFSIHDYKLESLAAFYSLLREDYNFNLETFNILLYIIGSNDEHINLITNYINSL
jgi:hypothetical protein